MIEGGLEIFHKRRQNLVQIAFQNVQIIFTASVKVQTFQFSQIRHYEITHVGLQLFFDFLFVFIPLIHQHTQRDISLFQIFSKTFKLILCLLALCDVMDNDIRTNHMTFRIMDESGVQLKIKQFAFYVQGFIFDCFRNFYTLMYLLQTRIKKLLAFFRQKIEWP